MSYIEIKDLHKSYGTNVILDGVDLNIEKGEVVAVIGPSGTGKSTLLRSLNRLETPEKGTFSIDGSVYDLTTHNKKELYGLRQNTEMVFQQFNLFKNRDVLRNVMEGLMVVQKLGKEEARKVAVEYLEKVGLEDHLGHYPRHLSGGQQQRVAIARALAMKPKLLLMDEPTSALDASSTKQVMGLLQKLRDESGVTVVIITHEMEVVRDYCDSVTLLEHGRVVQSGPIAKVLESPGSALAEDLVPRPNIDGVEIPPGKALLDISFTSSPGVPTGATVLNLVASLGADVAAGRFESIGEVQVGRLAITVPAYHASAIRGQLERNAILVREWV